MIRIHHLYHNFSEIRRNSYKRTVLNKKIKRISPKGIEKMQTKLFRFFKFNYLCTHLHKIVVAISCCESFATCYLTRVGICHLLTQQLLYQAQICHKLVYVFPPKLLVLNILNHHQILWWLSLAAERNNLCSTEVDRKLGMTLYWIVFRIIEFFLLQISICLPQERMSRILA